MIYFSFIGNHDQLELPGVYGSFLNIFHNYKDDISKVVIFITPATDRVDYPDVACKSTEIMKKENPGIEVIPVKIDVINPIDFDLLYPVMLNESLNVIEKFQLDNEEKIINITSGTPTMTACWVLLAQAGLIKNARLIQSFEKRFAKEGKTTQEVNLNIDDFPSINAPSSLKRQLTIKARENKELKYKLNQEELDKKVPDLIGTSKVIRDIKDQICHDINNQTHVLILGERGTGKEVVARAIWKLYHKANDDKLNTIDCGSIPRELVESELFGHKKGSFTGSEEREGILSASRNKMIFLDEIGNLPVAGQQKLLRVLSHGEIKKIGSNDSECIKIQIIAATNKDVDDSEIFAQDIKDRFDEVIILPPLRERREDIPLLIEHFIKLVTSENKTISPVVFDKDLIKRLCDSEWPGNVRELEKRVRKIIRRFPTGGLIRIDDIPERFLEDATPDEEDLFLPDLPLPIPFNEYIEKIRDKARQQAGGKMIEVDRLLNQKKGVEKQRIHRKRK